MVGILVSFWDGLFSGAMLVSGRVMRTKTYDGLCLQSLLTQSYSHVKTCWTIRKWTMEYCTLKNSTAQASQIATPNPHMHLPPPAPRARDRCLLPWPNSRYHHHLQIVVWSRSPWAKAPNEATLVEWDSMKLCRQRAAPRSVPSPSGRVPAKICFQTCGS